MPWQETLLMDQRVQFIADYQRDVFDVAELARRYGISRKTAYKWIDRYDVGGPAGLVDRSRRPAHCPHETPRADHRGAAGRAPAPSDVGRQEAAEDRGDAAADVDAPGPEYGL